MLDLDLKCLRCNSAMERGYLPDRGHADSMKIAEWVSDAPEQRWWGLRTTGHQQIPLSAYRCSQCGYVELRALDEGE